MKNKCFPLIYNLYLTLGVFLSVNFGNHRAAPITGDPIADSRLTRWQLQCHRQLSGNALKKGGDVSAFEKALDRALGDKADVKSLVSKGTLEVRDLDETVTRKEVVAALCIALGKPDLGDHCRLYKRFDSVQTAVVRLTEANARNLLGLSKLRVGWVNYRIREHDEVVRCFRQALLTQW